MVYGTVRAELQRKGRPIGSLDPLIAAHAVALDTVLVTHNTREFGRVEDYVIHTVETDRWTAMEPERPRKVSLLRVTSCKHRSPSNYFTVAGVTPVHDSFRRQPQRVGDKGFDV